MSPERWLRLEVDLGSATDREDRLYALSVCLVKAGSTGIADEGRHCVAYFGEPVDVPAFKALTQRRIAAQVSSGLTLRWSWQRHEEWAELWRQGFRSHTIGTRLRVTPPWVEPPVDDGRANVVIDPGVAFGTAEHGSTRSCLLQLERRVQGGETVLDVGAGSGVLAIAALKLGAASATCVEIDEMACQALWENAARNNVADRIQVRHAPFDTTVSVDPHDVVVCNMVRARLVPLLSQLGQMVASGGSIILGGVQSTERAEMTTDLELLGLGWGPPDVVDDEGWLAMHIKRGTRAEVEPPSGRNC